MHSGSSGSGYHLDDRHRLPRRYHREVHHAGQQRASGFVLTTILGIVGAFVATWLGQALGWYGPNQGAGLIGAAVGAIIVLAVWGFVAKRT